MALLKRTDTSNTQENQAMSYHDLINQLSSGNRDERRRSAIDLCQYPDNTPSLDLVAHLGEESDPIVREAILTSLIRLNDEVASRKLIELLRSDDANLRNGVIEALQSMPEAIEPYIQVLLTDSDSDVRIFTTNILKDLRHQDAQKWLLEVIRKDNHVNVCCNALDVLLDVGTPEIIPELELLIERFKGDPYVEFAVKATISRIQGK